MTKITKQWEDFSKWYLEIVDMADLADYSPVKWAMVVKPYWNRIWELMKEDLDKRIKEMWVENAIFPALIPESFIKKEEEHVEWFAPELLTVTRVWEKELEEPYVLRPTSETIIYDTYSKWVESYRDLPIKINQWANVFRWEMRTRHFLRTSEFFWQEWHTVHETQNEAEEMTKDALQMYTDFAREAMAIPSVPWRKTESEKFPWADYTSTIEALAKDWKAIQAGTSHHLWQNFSKSFDIKFVDKNEEIKYAWQSTWWVSTRLVWTLIVLHWDDNWLKLPPKIAPFQVVIIPIWKDEEIFEKSKEFEEKLKNIWIRVKIDNREKSPWFRINDWEMKWAPIRIEFWKRDFENWKITLARRDTFEKIEIEESKLEEKVENLLSEIQENMLLQAEEFLTANTHEVFDYETFKDIIKNKWGFVKAGWCWSEDCENKIKEETKASSRCIPFWSEEKNPGECIYCWKNAEHLVVFAKAY